MVKRGIIRNLKGENQTVMNKTRPLNQVRSIEDAILYVSSLPMTTPRQGTIMRNHWAIESMHWELDVNLLQDKIKQKSSRAARNLDTIQRIVCSIFSAWRERRKKKADKKKGIAELMRYISMSFSRLIRFLAQNEK